VPLDGLAERLMGDVVTPLAGVLLLAAICGALYLGIVPPWQHYDEPTHFEYAWLIANRGEVPGWGEHDPAMRREVAASMMEHGFFEEMDVRPNLLARDKAIGIGVSQAGSQPLYYQVAALPLRLISHADVTFQLYVLRTLSLLSFLVTVWIAGRVVGELTEAHSPLRWAVPGTMALLPAYTDVMTAVVDEAGAVLLFSLFLWGAVRMILRGVTVWRLIWVAGTAWLCVQTKPTAGIAVALMPLALILSLAPSRWGRWLWPAMGVGLILLAGFFFRWGDAAAWYPGTSPEMPTRRQVEVAPVGRHAMAVEGEVRQLLLREDVKALRGETVTLGSWIWAKEPTEVRSPMLSDGEGATSSAMTVGQEPTFHAMTGTISSEADWVEVTLHPAVEEPGKNTVYYDGVVLAEGEFPLAQPPVFDGSAGTEGEWGGRRFVNRTRNGSAEATGIWIRPWVERIIFKPLSRYHWRSPTEILASALDWQRTGRVYGRTVVHLFRSFWGHFGWDHVRLADGWFWGLAGATVMAVLGAVVSFVKGLWSGHSLRWRQCMVWLGFAALLLWGSVILRPHPIRGAAFIPGARYAFPAIIPMAFFLMGGWTAWIPSPMRGKAALALLVGLLILDAASVVTIITFYS